MLALAALISVSGGLGYALPAIVGLESMGVPSPGETALVLAAVLASEGKLQIWLVIVIAAASAIVGDNIGYWLGRLIGREVLEAPGPFQKRRKRLIAIGQRFFDKHGGKAVFHRAQPHDPLRDRVARLPRRPDGVSLTDD